MKETIEKYELLDEMLIGLFERDKGKIAAHDIEKVSRLRETAMLAFKKSGFPDSSIEQWRHTDLEALLEESFKYYLQPAKADRDIEEMFQCDVHNFNSDIVSMLNGWHFSKTAPCTPIPMGWLWVVSALP